MFQTFNNLMLCFASLQGEKPSGQCLGLIVMSH
jgi:hypothetical protein